MEVFKNVKLDMAKLIVDSGYKISRDDLICAAKHNPMVFPYLIGVNSFADSSREIISAAIYSKDINTLILAINTYKTTADCKMQIINMLVDHVIGRGLSQDIINFSIDLATKYDVNVCSIFDTAIDGEIIFADGIIKTCYNTDDALNYTLAICIVKNNTILAKILISKGADINAAYEVISSGILDNM